MMYKISLNDKQFDIDNYNKSTNFNNGMIDSNIFISLITKDITELNKLAEETITSIQIAMENGNVIYTLEDIEAKVSNINEFLSGDHININLNLTLNKGT